MDDTTRRFHDLHRSGCFVMPNPWDLGGLRILSDLGFKAVATTSAGFAWSMGNPDGSSDLDRTLGHLRLLADASSLPVNADFEAGFTLDPRGRRDPQDRIALPGYRSYLAAPGIHALQLRQDGREGRGHRAPVGPR